MRRRTASVLLVVNFAIAVGCSGGTKPNTAELGQRSIPSSQPSRPFLSSDVTRAYAISQPRPQYPPGAVSRKLQGIVVLKAVIDRRGNVADLQVVSGDPDLAKAAIKAVKQWRYRPYLVSGQPVEVETTITVNFTLEGM